MRVIIHECEKQGTRHIFLNPEEDWFELREEISRECTSKTKSSLIPYEVPNTFEAGIEYGDNKIIVALSNVRIYCQGGDPKKKIVDELKKALPKVTGDFYESYIEVDDEIVTAYYKDNLFIPEEDYINGTTDFPKIDITTELTDSVLEDMTPGKYILTSVNKGKIINTVVSSPKSGEGVSEWAYQFTLTELRLFKRIKHVVEIDSESLGNRDNVLKYLNGLGSSTTKFEYLDHFNLKGYEIEKVRGNYLFKELAVSNKTFANMYIKCST